MFILQAVLCLAVGLPSQPVDAIECYTCADATSIPDCTQSVTCSYDSTCFSEYTELKGRGLYTLGCKPSRSCSSMITPVTSGASLVGRSLLKQANCSLCCNTSNCNRQLCQDDGQACQDDHAYNCALSATQFDICSDVSYSKVHCRKYCGFCKMVDGSWSTWSAWSSCDVTCGTGTTSRHRTCSNPAPAHGGDDCLGSMVDLKNCTRNTCPVHGGWSQWSQWGTCSSSCDIGLQRRDRSCSDPYPAHFGEGCYGESRDDQLCFPGACANGGWSNWGAWGTCTVTCGGGVASRSRQCDNPTPSMTGVDCTGDSMQAESCNTSPCPVNGSWSQWGPWSQCSLTCGSGVVSRSRRCANPVPSSTGTDCLGDPLQTDSCNTTPCAACNTTRCGEPTFHVRDVSNQPTANSVIKFQKVVENVGDAYSQSSGCFTAPMGGVYWFSAQLCTIANSGIAPSIYIRGTLASRSWVLDGHNVGCGSVTAVATLKVGDTVCLKSGPNQDYNAVWSSPSYNTNNFMGAFLN